MSASAARPRTLAGAAALLVFCRGARRHGGARELRRRVFVQQPIYQDVNGLQLVAERNWLVGVQGRW